jgi:hypothetical protein
MKQVQHYDIIWTLRKSEQPDTIGYTPLVDGDKAGTAVRSQHYDTFIHRILSITCCSSTAMKWVQHYDIIWTLRTLEQPDGIDYTPLVDGNKAGPTLRYYLDITNI